MALKQDNKNGGTAPGDGNGIVGGRSNKEWKSLTLGREPAAKPAPSAQVVFEPMSRRVLDSLVRQADMYTGKEAIINMVKTDGAKLCWEDISELSGALEKSEFMWRCKMLGAVVSLLPMRPDLSKAADAMCTRISDLLVHGFAPLGYGDTEAVCNAIKALSRNDVWWSLLNCMRETKKSAGNFGKRAMSSAKSDDMTVNFKLEKQYEESWNSMARSALNNGAPFAIAEYVAQEGGSELLIPCLWAARDYSPHEKMRMVDLAESALNGGLKSIEERDIKLMREVPQDLQTGFIWSMIHNAFDKMAESDERETAYRARMLLPIIPAIRLAPFVKTAIESTAFPMSEAIKALLMVPPGEEAEELWKIAQEEFGALAKSGNKDWARQAKEALAFVPPERKAMFIAEAGWEGNDEAPGAKPGWRRRLSNLFG
ncbi:MAG: hypothetical protein WC717_03530 [Candidatus Micrarchaeia archaeon]|jgi:hypothetical protein